MNTASKIAIGAGVVAILGAGALVLSGTLPFSSTYTHPPCEQLPTTAQVEAGLAANQALANDIKAVGQDVAVAVGKPCPPGQDRALIEVTYGSDSERDSIRSLLTNRNGFGAPVHLVEK